MEAVGFRALGNRLFTDCFLFPIITHYYIEHFQILHNKENEIIFIVFFIFLSIYSYLSGKSINFANKLTDWLSYCWCQTVREFNNMLKISALRAYKAETHNLEVPGSSPGWSTLKISNLEEIRVADFSFRENNGKTQPFW